HHAEQRQRRDRAVAGGGVLEEDEVPALLPAEGVSVLAHLLDDVPVADPRAHHPPARLRHALVEAQAAHHRGHHRLLRQRLAAAPWAQSTTMVSPSSVRSLGKVLFAKTT